jgi:hypothetical protein
MMQHTPSPYRVQAFRHFCPTHMLSASNFALAGVLHAFWQAASLQAFEQSTTFWHATSPPQSSAC